MNVRRTIPVFVAGTAWASAALGCEPYRVEYRQRPDHHYEAAAGDLPDEITLEDGTRVVYTPGPGRKIAEQQRERQRTRREDDDGEERRRFKPREELDDGSIVLRALLPEHVLANTLECLRNEEYELLYEQMLAEVTRQAWESEGRTIEDFAEFFTEHRAELMRTLRRLYLGLSTHDTIMNHEPPHDITELRLRARVARDHEFTRVRIIPEGQGLKLLTIR